MNIYIVRLRTIIIAAVVFLALMLALFIPKTVTTFKSDRGKNLPVYSVERADNKIVLTFDCAWNDDDIESILETLEKYSVTAAFFVTGDWAQKYPEALAKIHNAGHIIGNHSYNHADYTRLGKEDIQADIKKADSLIREVCGSDTLYMRMPSGAYNDTAIAAAEDMGKICVQWSVDSLDYKENADEESILARLGKTASGDILLMHNGTELTAQLLPKIIKGLQKKYEFVSLDDMIYRENFEINHAGRQISLN